jgi:sugar fermentation stimulation protein A
MQFEQPLSEGRFLKRYKRFFADIDYHGETLTAHCPNTGSMMGLNREGAPCLFSKVDDPKRKLKFTLQMIGTETSWVGVNTGLPNKLVAELFTQDPLSHWQKFDSIQSEVKINTQSRIDLVLWSSRDHEVSKWNHKNLQPPLHLIEVKNVTLAQEGVAYFPDSVTARGLKHLDELIELKQQGFTCEMVFVIQRTDCHTFSPANHIDPAYGYKLKEALDQGVLMTPLLCELSPTEVRLTTQTVPLQIVESQ